MVKTNWGKTNLRFLRTSACWHRELTSSFEWLKKAGLVPKGVTKMPVRQVLTGLDPEHIDIEYIAAAAYEWDQWGPASPMDFIKAIEAEVRGAKRDLILETLMSLGREPEEAVA